MNILAGRRFNRLKGLRGMTELKAIRLCLKHRDPVGFEYLVGRYRREAYFHALNLLGNEADAADACQEAFARAYAALPGLSHLSAFYPWFYRILRNYCLNQLSRRKTRESYLASHQAARETESEPASPAFLVQKQEEAAQVWRALEHLTPEFREILALKYFQDANYDQIAALLDIPRGTVMSRLYHARRAFREAYLAPTSIPNHFNLDSPKKSLP